MKCPYKINKTIKRVTKEITRIEEYFGECDEEECFFYDEYAGKIACKRAENEIGDCL